MENPKPDLPIDEIFRNFYADDFGKYTDFELLQFARGLVYYVIPEGKRQQYRVREIVGIGGESVCVLAHDLWVRREVILKIGRLAVGNRVSLENRAIQESKARWLRAGKIMHALSETVDRRFGIFNRVYSSYLYPPVYELEYIRGLHPLDFMKGRDFPTVFRFFYRLTVVLKIVHDLGILHRDIKTSNIIVVPRRLSFLPAIIDFTMSVPRSKELGASTFHTVVNPRFCSELYASPLMRYDPSAATEMDDIFSLLRVLWVIIVGFEPDNPVVRPGAPIIPRCQAKAIKDKGIRRIYERGTSYDDNSYHTCEELLDDLRKYAETAKIDLSGVSAPAVSLEAKKRFLDSIEKEVGAETEILDEPLGDALKTRKIRIDSSLTEESRPQHVILVPPGWAGEAMRNLFNFIVEIQKAERDGKEIVICDT